MTAPKNDYVFKAGYLPGLREEDVRWHKLRLGAPDAPIWVEVPELTDVQLDALTQRIKQASRTHLKTMSVADIIGVLAKATARLLDAQDPYRQTLDTLLPKVTGFDPDMVRLNLTSYLQTFRHLELERFVTEDFANPRVLDAFVPRITGGWTQAYGPELLVHVWAGNVPALPMWSFVAGLLVKAGSIGKVASAEPLFASVYARLLADIEPRWADCFAVLWWPNDAPTQRTAYQSAQVVLAYGGNAALQAVQDQIPVTTRFLPHGHKISLGVVSAQALTVFHAAHVAMQAALDVVRFDQQGCYSPHMFYVQSGGSVSPYEFAQQLAHALASLQHKMPRRALSLEEASQISRWRDAHRFIALDNPNYHVLGDSTQTHAVVFSQDATNLMPSPLNRCIVVSAVDHVSQVATLIESARHDLQTVGLAVAPEELLSISEQLGLAGVTRICALGQMTSPAPGWHHDGRFSLLDLVRMVDVEASTEREADRFKPYAL